MIRKDWDWFRKTSLKKKEVKYTVTDIVLGHLVPRACAFSVSGNPRGLWKRLRLRTLRPCLGCLAEKIVNRTPRTLATHPPPPRFFFVNSERQSSAWAGSNSTRTDENRWERMRVSRQTLREWEFELSKTVLSVLSSSFGPGKMIKVVKSLVFRLVTVFCTSCTLCFKLSQFQGNEHQQFAFAFDCCVVSDKTYLTECNFLWIWPIDIQHHWYIDQNIPGQISKSIQNIWHQDLYSTKEEEIH